MLAKLLCHFGFHDFQVTSYRPIWGGIHLHYNCRCCGKEPN